MPAHFFVPASNVATFARAPKTSSAPFRPLSTVAKRRTAEATCILLIEPPMNPVNAQLLLLKCNGDEIWPEHVCVAAGVPQAWIEELIDQYESGFDTDRNTIYVADGGAGQKMTNQFRGVSDLLLAYKIAEQLGIDWRRETAHLMDRTSKVNALKEALDEI